MEWIATTSQAAYLAALACVPLLFALLALHRTRVLSRGPLMRGGWIGVDGRQVATPPHPAAQRSRELVAIVAIAVLALGGWGATRFADLGSNESRVLLALLGVVGVVTLLVARQPLVAAQRSARRIRKAVPGFVSFVQIALSANETPLAILRRYIEIPVATRSDLQAVVARALARSEDENERPFQALAVVAQAWGLRELTNVAEDLAQAEVDGSDMADTLEAQRDDLDLVLKQEFQRELVTKTLAITGIASVAVVSIVFTILLINVVGGGVIVL